MPSAVHSRPASTATARGAIRGRGNVVGSPGWDRFATPGSRLDEQASLAASACRFAYASTAAALGYAATPADVAPYYTIGIAAPVVAPPAFTITATALGAQVADGGLTIDNQGTKTPSGKW